MTARNATANSSQNAVDDVMDDIGKSVKLQLR